MSKNVYYPKTLARFAPKTDPKLSLKSLCLDATLKLLLNLTKKGDQRNARVKKTIRKYLDGIMPREIQNDVLQRSLGRWFGTDRLLSLMDIFEPSLMIKDKVDLIGSFRYAYGCYYANHRLYWSNGTIERLNLNEIQCERLYSMFLWGSPQTVRSICISTQRMALAKSRMPSMLARSQMLTSATILNGTTNHILRILGLNCPHLKFLDISHSQGVTDSGLRGLLLRYPRQTANYEKNRCAMSLRRIITIGTEVTADGLDFTCLVLGYGYAVSFLPDTMIYRPDISAVTIRGLNIDSSVAPLWQLGLEDQATRGIELTLKKFSHHRRGTAHTSQLIDFFKIGYNSQIFIRPLNSYIAQAMLGIEGNVITKLILTWDSFTWSVTNLPELTELGLALPNLTILKARLQGTWDRTDVLFSKLVETFVWTVSDSTVLSFLQHCPAIQTFKFNCLDLVDHSPIHLTLNDHTLRLALVKNTSLLTTLVEISIRPALHLTAFSVQFLIKKCKNLRRLGDLESWKVTPEDIKNCNHYLDRNNSQCILTVLSFPPKHSPEFLL